MKCVNCKKDIKNENTACYSKEVNEYFCSLDCLTNYAHEYLGCIPINQVELQTPKQEKGG